MTTETSAPNSIEIIEIKKEIDVAAPIEITFAVTLEEIGPHAEMLDGTKMPLKLEAWPGGRWFRDLGNDTGHLWGHVQVIKPPTLLEICGPLMMSYPAANHVQYRLTAQGNRTHVSFVHRGMGLILPQHREGMPKGWAYFLDKIRASAEQKAIKSAN